jgi:hypothetical protein
MSGRVADLRGCTSLLRFVPPPPSGGDESKQRRWLNHRAGMRKAFRLRGYFPSTFSVKEQWSAGVSPASWSFLRAGRQALHCKNIFHHPGRAATAITVNCPLAALERLEMNENALYSWSHQKPSIGKVPIRRPRRKTGRFASLPALGLFGAFPESRGIAAHESRF